jgi:hypothetical protein
MAEHVSWDPEQGWIRTPLPAASSGLTISETLEKSRALDGLLAAPLPRGKIMSATSLADRIRAVRQSRDARFSEIERDHLQRIGAAEKRQNEALDRLEQKLASDAELNEAEVRALEDEVNQLTNGGPQS